MDEQSNFDKNDSEKIMQSEPIQNYTKELIPIKSENSMLEDLGKF